MEPVIVGAVVTVAVSVVNGIVRIAQRQLNASVEIARITEAAHTARVRCLTGQVAAAPRLARRPVPVPADRIGGEDRGGRPRN